MGQRLEEASQPPSSLATSSVCSKFSDLEDLSQLSNVHIDFFSYTSYYKNISMNIKLSSNESNLEISGGDYNIKTEESNNDYYYGFGAVIKNS